MPHAIIFDCEYLTNADSFRRFWCGRDDPDPVVAQIGAVKLSLKGEILDTLRLHVIPLDRSGQRCALHPAFTRRTGVTEETLDREGVALGIALAQLDAFGEGARLWSRGMVELNLIGISGFIAGITMPLPATRFGNVCTLALKAGMALEDVHKTRSNTLAACFGVEPPPLRGHDAGDDAQGVAYTLQHLLRQGALTGADFA